MLPRRPSLPLLAALFAGSGFAALVYEVAWERMLGIFSGVHLRSITLIVAAFMAGLGLGSLGGGRLADRLGRRAALLAFAACEAAIGIFALASPWVYHDLTRHWLARLEWAAPLSALLQFVLLLPPTLLMGASLPLLARGVVRERETAARSIAVLYGVNTVGAAIGAWATSWWLVGAVGLVGSVRVAAVTNLLVALLALAVARRVVAERDDASPAETVSAAAAAPGFRGWCAAFALSGFLALSLEILWFRTLGVAMKSSSFTFGHLLGVFLVALGAGSVAGSLRAHRFRRPDRVFLWGQWGAVVLAVLAVVLLVRSPFADALREYWYNSRNPQIYDLVHVLENPDARTPIVVSRFVRVFLLLPSALMVVPTFMIGFTFAAVQRAVQTDPALVGRRVGLLMASNIGGAILGTVATGTWLLDRLGTPGTLRLLTLLALGFPLLLLRRVPADRVKASVAVALGLVVAFAIPSPDRFWATLHGDEVAAVVAAEDSTGVVALHALDPGLSVLKIDGRGHGVLPYGNETTLYGLIPALLRPGATDAAVVGLGTGDTTWALGIGPGLERIDVFELVRPLPDLLGGSSYLSGGYTPLKRLLRDARIRLRFVDGRFALRRRDRLYDLIQTDSAEPSMAHSGNLYSREFFELVRDRLEPGGLFCTMAPTERTLRTMAMVFPHLLDFHAPHYTSFIIGSNEPLHFDPEALAATLNRRDVRKSLREVGELKKVVSLVERYLAQVDVREIDTSDLPVDLAGDVNTDLFPRDEFDKRCAGRYR